MAKHIGSKLLLGATVIGAAAAGVFAFFTQSPKGKKLWSEAMEHAMTVIALVTKKAEKMKSLTAASYARLVDEVMDEYQAHRQLTEETTRVLTQALKKEWKTIERGLKPKPRALKKQVKK